MNFKKTLFSVLLLSLPLHASWAQNNLENNVNSNVKTNINWNLFFIGHAWLNNTAGVMYFKQDLENDPKKICKDLEQVPWRLSMIDQESSEIYRLNIPQAIPPSYNTELSIEDFSQQVSQSAIVLKDYCVRINLAPVADNQKGNRIYSNDKKRNEQYVKSFADNMRRNNVIPTYKHFPGLNKVEGTVYENKNNHYYKNIYGEGVIEKSTLKDLMENAQIFSSNNADVLMFSIALYPNVKDSQNKPIIFSEEVWNLAYKVQPNSLYIPDDLSELNLSEEEILYLFKKFDLLMFTSPKDIFNTIIILENLYKNKYITKEEILQKIHRQNEWRKKNKLPIVQQSIQ